MFHDGLTLWLATSISFGAEKAAFVICISLCRFRVDCSLLMCIVQAVEQH
jgi:hypothetical protein